MDFIKLKSRISQSVEKYKYVWIVLLVGVMLMILPERKNEDGKLQIQQKPEAEAEAEVNLDVRLEEVLSHVIGAGNVKVMLSVSQGERTIYQTDTTYSQTENHTDSRTQTILVRDDQRNETGLVHQKNPPTYQGAIVLAQGADDPVVKLAIVDAVSDITGLGADRITVLKMR